MRFPALRALSAFLAFQFLCGQAHELTHHGAARLICGAWGTMTFDYFHLPEAGQNHPLALWSTFAGPALTYGLMLLSAWLMGRARSDRSRAFGLLLFFANLPMGRLASVVSGHGDEMVLARAWVGGPMAWPIILVLALVLLLPPLLAAWRALPVRRRAWSFTGLLLLPLLADVVLKRLFLARVMPFVPGEPVFGLPPFLIGVDLAFLVVALLVLPPWRVTFELEPRTA